MRKSNPIIAVALLAGAALGYFVGKPGEPASMSTSSEREVLYWKAPMDPNYRSDKPGKSPMGMDLIPVYADEQAVDDPNAIKISAAVVNNLGVRTEAARVEDLAREIDTVGFVSIDEDKASHVHVRTSGWVEKLYRKAIGEEVKENELIFALYSPELVNAQTEFVQALRLKQQTLVGASKERLKALGMTVQQIAGLQRTGEVKQLIEVRAPQDGVIVDLQIGEGMHVTPGKTVFSLADLSTIWVKVDVFEAQSDWVKEGQPATMTLPFLPGESWVGEVEYVYPIVDAKSRTVQVRLAFENTDGRLKPNMYGEMSIAASPVRDVVSIAREALIRTGKTDRVILAVGDGKFRPAEVLAGRESGDRVEIVKGLRPGETVVTSGQFLLDSEASINSAFLRLLESDAEDEHAGHDMPNAEAASEVHHGMGTYNAITSEGAVNLSHEPIGSLDWPAMTMDFVVSPDVDLSNFQPGDGIHFELSRAGDGSFVITKAVKM